MSNLVTVRLLFINEHREIDRVDLPSTGAKIYGRPGNPLRLDYSELGGPPATALCRIRVEDGGWYLENLGADGQTLVNNQPLAAKSKVALQDWAEIRCGTQMVRFEHCGARHGGADLAVLRERLDVATKAADEAHKALEQCAAETGQRQAQLDELVAASQRQSVNEAALRKTLSSAARQQDALRERMERQEREAATQRTALSAENKQLSEALRELHEQKLEDQKEREALRLQAARARRELADCQAKLQRRLAESALPCADSPPAVPGTAGAIPEPIRQTIKALDRAVIDANYAVHSCEERWNRTAEELTASSQRHALLRELRQLSSVTNSACAFLDQLHRLMPMS